MCRNRPEAHLVSGADRLKLAVVGNRFFYKETFPQVQEASRSLKQGTGSLLNLSSTPCTPPQTSTMKKLQNRKNTALRSEYIYIQQEPQDRSLTVLLIKFSNFTFGVGL